MAPVRTIYDWMSADPSADWAALREQDGQEWPLDEAGTRKIRVYARHDSVKALLGGRNPKTSNKNTLMPLRLLVPEAMGFILKLGALPVTAAGDPGDPTDPPDGSGDHRTMRRALNAAFDWNDLPGPVARFIRKTIMRLMLDSKRRAPSFDLAEVATLLPLLVIMYLIGAPEKDWEKILGWSDGQVDLVWGVPSPAEQVRLAENLLKFWQYCEELVHDKSKLPDGCVTKNLLNQGLTEQVVASFIFNLLVAGHETTRNLLVAVFRRLLEDRKRRWELVQENKFLIPAGVKAAEHTDPPIAAWIRTMPNGEVVLVHIGAANRDKPKGYNDDAYRGDEYDIIRQHQRRQPAALSYGYGAHFCVGAALARLEAELMVSALLELTPNLVMPEQELEFGRNAAFYGPKKLIVARG